MRPRLFIGSSTESLAVARAIKANLDHDADATVWTEGVFRPSRTALESLLAASIGFDFAVFVFSPDDVLQMRGKADAAVRDNVIFELGLFVGQLGRERCFIVQPRGEDMRLPTDLLGFTPVTYDPRLMNNARSALGSVCDDIRHELGNFRIAYPPQGFYGTNLLSSDLTRLVADQPYSLRATAPRSSSLRIAIQNTRARKIPWMIELGSERGWMRRSIDWQNKSQEFELPAGQDGDAKLISWEW